MHCDASAAWHCIRSRHKADVNIMDLPKDVMLAVNQAVLGQALNDPDLHHKAGIMAQIADLLKCDPASARTGFLNELMDLNADLLSQTEKKKVIERQKAKLQELEEAKVLVRKQIDHANANLTKAEIQKLRKKVNELNSVYQTVSATSKAVRKRLDDMGFSEDISDARFNRKKVREEALQQEISELEKEVAQFEGVAASDDSFRAKTAELLIRIENFSSLYDVGH